MPTYRYSCVMHGEFETWASIHEDSRFTDCDLCGLRSPKVIVSPQLSPRLGDRHLRESQSKPSAAPAGNNNSWERGTATDHRGAPLWDTGGSPIPLKQYAQHRHKYEARRRELANHPDPFGGVAAQSLKEGR